MKQIKIRHNKLKTALLFGVASALSFFACAAFADTVTIGSVAQKITGTMGNLAKLITAGSYVAGFGFAVGAILKFKAHKDNPTQIPIGTPIALIFVAAALIFLPQIFGVTGKTMFGGGAETGTVTGVTTFQN
ncbi:MAG: type IV secretion protein IcmD [Gammaproteobacteria bacterium]